MELLYGLPHAEPVAALHGDHQHLPSLGPSPDAHTEQDSSQHQPPKLQSQGHPCTNQKLQSLVGLCHLYLLPYLCFIIKSLKQNGMSLEGRLMITHILQDTSMPVFITSAFTRKDHSPLSWKNSFDSAAPSGEHSSSLSCSSSKT